MNELQTFVNEELGKYIRTVEIENEPWFIGKDITDILGYKNGSRDIVRHVFEEDYKYIKREESQKYRNGTFEIPNRGTLVINESGVYALIFGSKLESAKKFKHWVTSEVLPAIRKNGMYSNMDPEYRLKCAEIISKTPVQAIKSTAFMLGFDIPDNYIMSERRQKQLSENPLKDFIESLGEEIKQFTPIKFLWENYLKWCENNQNQPVSRIDFSRKLVVFLDREIINKKIDGVKMRVIS